MSKLFLDSEEISLAAYYALVDTLRVKNNELEQRVKDLEKQVFSSLLVVSRNSDGNALVDMLRVRNNELERRAKDLEKQVLDLEEDKMLWGC